MKVLYVEDDPIDADLTRTQLAKIAPHIELEIVRTQLEALDRLKDQKFKTYDLVLSDMKLPDGDGRAIIAHIRGRSIPLPVVMVTGSGSQETAVTAIKAGADDYIVKRRGYLEKLPQIMDNALSNFQGQTFLRAKPLMVLYAEDNIQDSEITQKHFLVHAPYIQLTIVNSGKEVLEYLRDQDQEKKIDIILLDYKLLGGDALEILKTLRFEYGNNLPVIFITGHGDEEVAVSALKLGANDYIPKSPGYLDKLPFVLGNAYHFTEMTRKQKALKASEEKFALAFQTSPVWVALTTLEEGRILEINEAFSTITGFTKEEAIEQTTFDLGLWADPEERSRIVKACEAKQGVKDQEVVFRMKSGELRICSLSANIINLNGTACLISAVLDITERKRLERESTRLLQEKEQIAERLSLILESTDQGIFGVDRVEKFTFVNRAAARMLNYEPDELLGKNAHPLIHHSHRNGAPYPFKDCPIHMTLLKGEDCYRDDDIFWRRNGDMFPAEYSSFPIRQKEKILGAVVTFRDISKRLKEQERLNDTMNKLREAMEGIIQAMALTVETRDPYTAGHQKRVAGLARMIAREMGLSADQIEGLFMAGVVHDLGKISVPAEILVKPTKLSDIEFSLIKIHPQTSYEILKDIDFPWPVAKIAHQHHERIDGSGYPLGLKDKDILSEAKILAVADVVEAMASHRPYRPGWGSDKALEEISLNRGRLYDPQAVDACLRLFREKGYKLQ